MEVQVFLDRGQVDHTERAHVRRIFHVIFSHHFASPLNNAAHTRFAHEHVMCLFGQHEAASAREGIEARFCQSTKLEFSVAVGKESEHVKRQPVRRGLIERA